MAEKFAGASNIFILTPEEILKLGLSKEIQIATKNLPSSSKNREKNEFKEKLKTSTKRILKNRPITDFIKGDKKNTDNVEKNFKIVKNVESSSSSKSASNEPRSGLENNVELSVTRQGVKRTYSRIRKADESDNSKLEVNPKTALNLSNRHSEENLDKSVTEATKDNIVVSDNSQIELINSSKKLNKIRIDPKNFLEQPSTKENSLNLSKKKSEQNLGKSDTTKKPSKSDQSKSPIKRRSSLRKDNLEYSTKETEKAALTDNFVQRKTDLKPSRTTTGDGDKTEKLEELSNTSEHTFTINNILNINNSSNNVSESENQSTRKLERGNKSDQSHPIHVEELSRTKKKDKIVNELEQEQTITNSLDQTTIDNRNFNNSTTDFITSTSLKRTLGRAKKSESLPVDVEISEKPLRTKKTVNCFEMQNPEMKTMEEIKNTETVVQEKLIADPIDHTFVDNSTTIVTENEDKSNKSTHLKRKLRRTSDTINAEILEKSLRNKKRVNETKTNKTLDQTTIDHFTTDTTENDVSIHTSTPLNRKLGRTKESDQPQPTNVEILENSSSMDETTNNELDSPKLIKLTNKQEETISNRLDQTTMNNSTTNATENKDSSLNQSDFTTAVPLKGKLGRSKKSDPINVKIFEKSPRNNYSKMENPEMENMDDTKNNETLDQTTIDNSTTDTTENDVSIHTSTLFNGKLGRTKKSDQPQPIKNENPEMDETKNSESDQTSIGDLNLNNSTTHGTETSTPLKKRRGRPRKSEQLQSINTVILEKSSRTKKRVNYFEMANPETENMSENVKVSDSPKLEKQSITTPLDQSSIDSTDLNQSVPLKRKSTSPKKCNLQSIKVEETTKNIDDTNKEAVNVSQSKRKRTGDTAALLNNLFAMANKNNSTELNNEHSENSSTSKLGRPKKYQDVVVTNETVHCNLCSKDIKEKQWKDHNFYEHYNFSWRTGETRPVFENDVKTSYILQSVIKKLKVLKCMHCKKEETTVKAYISHVLNCAIGTQNSTFKIKNNNYICAVCDMEVEKSKWFHHKSKIHNNLAWRVGETPLDLNNKSFVMNVLTNLYKKKKPLNCYKCGSKKKSVVGFLSHQTMCMKSNEEMEAVKIECPLCHKKFLPVSLSMHNKLIHGKPENADVATKSEEVLTEKRKAHEKAMNLIEKYKNDGTIIQQKYYSFKMDPTCELVKGLLEKELVERGIIRCKFLECQFQNSCMEEVVKHLSSCKNSPQEYFTCNQCLLVGLTEIEIRKHLKTNHSVNCKKFLFPDNDFVIKSEDISEETQITEKKLKYKVKPMFLPSKTKGEKTIHFPNAHQWTRNFYKENYSIDNLFEQYKNKSPWLLLDDNLLDQYLPQLDYSCDVAITNASVPDKFNKDLYSFKQYELFESQIHENGNTTVFVGGAISAMAWSPIPIQYEDCNQILAVSVLNNPNAKYAHNSNYAEKCLIQFWDFGNLQNTSKSSFKPKLLFGMAVDFGPVWHLEWCPSGCYSAEDTIGLLAMGASDSYVYIFSVPAFKEEESGLFYKPKPVAKLQLGNVYNDSMGKQQYYPTKISWTKSASHKYVAVGYSNGFVGLFNVETDSEILNTQHEDVKIILPYKSFQPHYHCITALQLIHLKGGNRWLMTASFDRSYYVWDLTSLKIVDGEKRKHIVTDGTWMTHWLSCITTADETTTTNIICVNTSIYQIREYSSEQANALQSTCSLTSLTTNDWLNTLIVGSAAGEIIGLVANQLMYSVDNDKNLRRNRVILGSLKLIEKEDDPLVSVDALIYEEAVKRYSILLCDANLHRKNHNTSLNLKQSYSTEAKPNIYPIQAITKVAFNPNLRASTYFATGYQVGLLRTTWMQYLSQDIDKI